jgi:hypothetical protein
MTVASQSRIAVHDIEQILAATKERIEASRRTLQPDEPTNIDDGLACQAGGIRGQ